MRPRLVAAMLVRNEADRYLRMVLDDLATYCDRICVLDDGSTDATPELCSGYAHVRLVRQPTSEFWLNEAWLRSRLWALATELQPEWILACDADEVLEERFKREADRYLGQRAYPLVGAQLHEFWGCLTHYRVDKLWSPHGKYTPMLVRHLPGFPYQWSSRPLHCGRVPYNCPGPMLRDGLRAKHFGYADPADHARKHDLYLRHDPGGRFCPRSHYESIIDPPAAVRLEAWQDGPPPGPRQA